MSQDWSVCPHSMSKSTLCDQLSKSLHECSHSVLPTWYCTLKELLEKNTSFTQHLMKQARVPQRKGQGGRWKLQTRRWWRSQRPGERGRQWGWQQCWQPEQWTVKHPQQLLPANSCTAWNMPGLSFSHFQQVSLLPEACQLSHSRFQHIPVLPETCQDYHLATFSKSPYCLNHASYHIAASSKFLYCLKHARIII